MVRTMSRGYFGVFVVVAATMLLCVLAGSSGATVGDTTRVSVNSSGTQANGISYGGPPTISSDGRYVAFTSNASNLVADDTNGNTDVFVHDQAMGTTERVSVDKDGHQAYGGLYPSISADGRYVAFVSCATGLVPGSDDTTTFEVFVRDRQEGTTERVSVDKDRNQPNGNSFRPSISSDGRDVAFYSGASDLVASDTNNSTDVFVRDRQEGTTERVSVDKDENQAPAASWAPSISSDGRFVALTSNGLRPLGFWSHGGSDIFVRDRQLGTTQWVSRDISEADANGDNFSPTLSSDGRLVAFTTKASDMVAGDTNGSDDVLVRDRSTGAIERVSVNGCGIQANGTSYGPPSISPDGRFVAFSSLPPTWWRATPTAFGTSSCASGPRLTRTTASRRPQRRARPPEAVPSTFRAHRPTRTSRLA
jgi:Tol biopolymer transport system component